MRTCRMDRMPWSVPRRTSSDLMGAQMGSVPGTGGPWFFPQNRLDDRGEKRAQPDPQLWFLVVFMSGARYPVALSLLPSGLA